MNDGIIQIKRGTTPTVMMNLSKDLDLTKITDIWFSISQSGSTSEPIIKRGIDTCNIDAENNRIWVLLTQPETLRLIPTTPSTFGYSTKISGEAELSIIFDNGARTTSKKYTVTVLENVREGVMSGNPLSVTEPLPESIELDVEFESVVNVAPMSYSDLQNKPQINGNELIGNKTNAELGIPTKTSELENDANFQENVIESVSVNGTVLEIENKSVDIIVPTKTSDIDNDSGFITLDDVTIQHIQKNSVELPISNKTVNISVPTDTSDLTNNAGYITDAGISIKSISVNASVITPDGNRNVDIPVPTQTSDIENNSGFITNSVNNLVNYYLKADTYTKDEVNSLIGSISTLTILVVQELPTEDIQLNTIYFVPKNPAQTDNYYDEYIYVNNVWELIGDTEIDLSDYITSSELQTALSDYTPTASLGAVALSNSYTDLSNKPTIPTQTSQLTNNSGFITSADIPVKSISENSNALTPDANGNVDVTVPTKVSDLNNDSGFITGITSSDVTTALGYTPYNSSNPSGYQTASDVEDAVTIDTYNGLNTTDKTVVGAINELLGLIPADIENVEFPTT